MHRGNNIHKAFALFDDISWEKGIKRRMAIHRVFLLILSGVI